ncbi:MAG: integrase arm-type DNA-binding domain-containing protein [Zoogloeaceae bacterium]|jgi:integrase|nr:integrase arm-type DNA-binding domain-containing protein [Zoogloeaceae bacterium]
MPLSDTAIKNAKPAAKPYKLADEKGLYLFVTPAGGKLWRMQYRFEGKQKLLALGKYPDISLKDARERRDEARKLLANGVDPGEVKKAQKTAKQVRAANSFEVLAREWFEKWKTDKAESHYRKVIARLENDVFPWLGGVPVSDVTAPLVLAVLRRIESRGVIDTAHRAKESISLVMRFAIATGRAERDPCPDLRGALQPLTHTHMAAITDPKEVGRLLRAISEFKGLYTVRAALLLAPMVFVRPGELRAAKWADISFERAEWRYVASKTRTNHLVPLARQAVALLQEIYPLTGHGAHVFPGRDPQKSISNSTINAALTRMGYDTRTEMTGHGFRAMARTLLAEELHFPAEIIEHQLAHRVPDSLGEAYNRTRFLKERREMMQAWADYLDRLRVGADVIPLRGNAA